MVESGDFDRLPARESSSQTVLLVEDERAVRQLGRRILERSGYLVIEATSGIDALERSKNHEGPIHLMLTDVVMPEMGGRELVEHLSPLRPDMRVLYMSGYSDDTVIHQDVRASDIAFLQKPFEKKTLLRKVREVLDTRPIARGPRS